MKRKLFSCLVLAAVAVAALWLALARRQVDTFRQNTGLVFGTTYTITYCYHDDLHAEIKAAMAQVDSALSTFNPASDIARVNRGEDIAVGPMFRDVFLRAQQVSKATGGAFDITVAPLVNAWGFGFKHESLPTRARIDSLLTTVGWSRVALADGHVRKANPATMLDCASIAKGYGCDVVAALLRSKGIADFLVEIGGEVVAAGANSQGKSWRIGIARPIDDSLSTKQDNYATLPLADRAMATSGNYRNYYYHDGQKLSHTIDPHTGRPVQHSLLSATVLADSCTTADAYATAFMVLGLERAKAIVQADSRLGAYLIYKGADGKLRSWSIRCKATDMRQ